MRTTITLDPDVEALVRRSMAESGGSFKNTINKGLRRGLSAPGPATPYKLRPSRLGEPRVPLVKALQLAAEMEDAAIIEKLRQGR